MTYIFIFVVGSRAGSEKMEKYGDGQKKNERTLFNRPKLTPGCSASGRRRRFPYRCVISIIGVIYCLTQQRKFDSSSRPDDGYDVAETCRLNKSMY
jgi:hypothetical protein